ncbi:BTAD domain-containing putative transcriptional regulator [Mycobacterium sp. E2699]|uniref:BTAD domain-containing putative transcriptional regulator n=1 Tax=Mycobacterium sp. E2699 TaxID=1834137 RepID=UPI00350EBCC9
MLGLHDGSVVSADSLVELLWGDDPPRTAAKALQTHISLLRRTLGDGFVLTQGAGWALAETEVDAARYKAAARSGRDAAAAGDDRRAVVCFDEALALWRGIPELPGGRRGTPEKTRWIEAHAALVEDRADALLATGRAAEIVGELEAAVADAPLRERRWGQLMLALYRAGRQGEALGAYQRARALLADELGVDPGPNLRRLETLIVAQDVALEVPATQRVSPVTRAVTFLLTDIEGSTAAWEADAGAMAAALARHDELVEQVVTSRGGRLIKTRGEGDATFSVFDRPSAAAAAAIELQDAIDHEPWALSEPMRVRVALHTGEAELRDGDYFGRAVNRAARLRSLATGGQILCSGATAELVIDSLPDHVALADLGKRELRNLARPEHVFELRLDTADDQPQSVSPDAPMQRPALPAVLSGPGPFVGRGNELQRLFSAWQTALAGGTNAILIAGEPGVGKTRLAGEWSLQAYDQGALVIYGRCDEDLGAPYQPFAEALRALVPCLGAGGLRGLRGVEALLALVPGLIDFLPDLAPPTRADPDTERYALFDAVVAVLVVASASAPVVLILDDLHWAAKPTLLLLRHLLRFGEQARVQIIGTYRSTDLDRSHPLAAMLADLHRDGSGNRIQLSGLDEDDVTAYVAEAGYHDEELARALASVTGGNPFFLIEALRHVDESGGRWDQSTLPQGVREAVTRRLTRLLPETNKALAAAAVVGSRFDLELVERVVGDDLVDAFDEACKAGIVIEEPGGRYRFNHALVRQSLLAELPSVRRMRLHQRIATTLESQPGADDELLAELAHHYFECAWAGNAAKAVEYCHRAADQAMTRLAYEGAADLYDHALHALEEIDDELPDRDDQAAELLVARCEALLAAGDVAAAAGAVSQLQGTTVDSARLAAWATCFDGQLSMLIHPERLDEAEAALSAAAAKLAELDDAAGEAKAHTVRAGCLARLGRIGDCEVALDDALTAARRAREHRRVNNVLANAPLAALWGPNPVPRAGGRCLDVVRLLRITTDSPAVEATSTRCQAVLEAFRGRAAAARRMIDSARRTVTELGLRHALLEVEQFAGIVELVVDEPAAAETPLLKAYNGFRRMGLDADTAETAALLGRACLALGRDAEADELCSESERLAGHALKPSIAWRTLRAQLLSRAGDHGEARRVAEDAVSLAERTDALVDHGDACATLAMVLGAAGDVAGARAAAERAVGLYERKGAAALAEKARGILGKRVTPVAETPPEAPSVELDNAAARVGERVMAAIHRRAWDEVDQLFAPDASIESRRKIVGLTLSSEAVRRAMRRELELGTMRINHVMVAARGERLALSRLITSSPDVSVGAPRDELLQLYAINDDGQVAWQVWFDVEDVDTALAELDMAHARFVQERPQAKRLENAAYRMFERMQACFTARDWDALAGTLVGDFHNEDRRRVVNGGVLRGQGAAVETMRRAAELGITHATSTVLATRGKRLVLAHARFAQGDENPETFQAEALQIAEINAEGQLTASILFDADDLGGATAELDARYLAGEATAHARTWSVIGGVYAALNRHELPATTPDWINIDHRSLVSVEAGGIAAYLRATWDHSPDAGIYIEAVHRLSDMGAVLTHAAYGTSHKGFDAEWRMVELLTFDGDLISRSEMFDEADVDDAVARFDQLSRPARRLENAASQVTERLLTCFTTRDWDLFARTLAGNISTDDRRRVVNAGVRQDRDAELKDFRSAADLGVANATSDVIATRGERLVLTSLRLSRSEGEDEGFHVDLLWLIEIDADKKIAAWVTFDLDDFGAAITELDARYLAGEAAAHSHIWAAALEAYAAINRRELPALTPNFASIDHRRGTAFAPGELIEYLRAGWDLDQGMHFYIEAVHRLSDLGLVVTHTGRGTSREGFDAEWREVALLTASGDAGSRYEVFEEADLDAAIARFDQLSRPAPRLKNAASQVAECFLAHFSTGDWDAMAKLLADIYNLDDRRRVVGAGVRHGREAQIVDLRAIAEVWITNVTPTVIAIRGERLVLMRVRHSDNDQQSDAFHTDALVVGEINDDELIVAAISFDLDDIDAAFEELDARYLAGEAAAHARTWSVIRDGYAALNRHELPPTAATGASIDHRRGRAFAPGDLAPYIRATWDLTPNARIYVEAVHRLSNLGAVVTHASHGASTQGFDAEWREVTLVTVDGAVINRGEMFDEEDVDAAIARFDQLSRPAPRLENAATRVFERYQSHLAARDWEAIAATVGDHSYTDDRRRVVNAGIRHAPDAVDDLRALTDVGFRLKMVGVVATRGERLALTHVRGSGQGPGAIENEALNVVEIDADERFAAVVVFDLEDFDAAIAELDARYLNGEAAPHARVWSVITRAYAALNRRELPPTTPDWVNIDHRRGTSFGFGEMPALLDAAWNFTTDLSHSITAVHRLNDLGAVITNTSHETSQEGFDAEWRVITVGMVEGGLLNRCEIFDAADLDAALARFEELSSQIRRLENAASQAYERFRTYFAARDWVAMSELLTSDTSVDDHRRVVNAEIRRGRDVEIANMRAFADIGARRSVATVLATRGERLVLCRTCVSGEDNQAGEFRIEMLVIVETSADKRILARVAYDPDDIDAAFAELDARYLAGEAAAHAHTWSIVSAAYAAMNRHELFATTPDWANVDHRRPTIIEEGGLNASLLSLWKLVPDITFRIIAVHRLTDLGAVCTHTADGVSEDGFGAEWHGIEVMTVERDLINRCEIFDEADLDTAIARFDELSGSASRLKNPASDAAERLLGCLATGDWDAMAKTLADNFSQDDRRRVVGAGLRHGPDAQIADMRAITELQIADVTSTLIATRGERLALAHARFSDRDQDARAFLTEVLGIVEIDSDGRIVAAVSFDPDDVDAAFEELDGRYLAGEAAPYASAWQSALDVLHELNRHESGPMIKRLAYTDHRRVPFADGDYGRAIEELWLLVPDARYRFQAVHALDARGVVASLVIEGTDAQGSELQWGRAFFLDPDEPRLEIYEESDVDAAIARFKEPQRRAPLLENTASQIGERFLARFAAADWDAMAELLADDFSNDDRRRVVGVGVRNGRGAQMADMRTIADLFSTTVTTTTIAIRGANLALMHLRFSARDHESDAFVLETVCVLEINSDQRIFAAVFFDVDGLDAAFEELDRRYLAGEAAPYARVWKSGMDTVAELNRHEPGPRMRQLTYVDHRRVPFASGEDFGRGVEELWELVPDAHYRVTCAHALDSRGTVVTFVIEGTDKHGNKLQWRRILLFDSEAPRLEVYEEEDLDAALARFEELRPESRRLENAATRVDERFWNCYAARDWDAMAEILTDDLCTDDRRRVVNAGLRHGRDDHIAEMRAVAEMSTQGIGSTVLATRGERLALTHVRVITHGLRPEEVSADVLNIVEIGAGNRIVARIGFDIDDIDAAFEELDARYLAGEAAAYSQTWTAMTQVQTVYNRHEFPRTTKDCVNIDHRRGRAFSPDDVIPFLRASFDVVPNLKGHIEAVHRLSNSGAVVTEVMTGTSQEGFDAEWREIGLFAFDGDLVCRFELFDETDLDAALARFEELRRQAARLKNAASQVNEHFFSCYAARDWAAMAQLLADDISTDDRREVVNAGVLHGRGVHIENMRAVAEFGANMTVVVIATRGARLALTRICSANVDLGAGEFLSELLYILEIDADHRITAGVFLDANDIDAAFEELDARYRSGEAAAHAHTWSVISGAYPSVNRHELPAPTTQAPVYIDHRPLVSVEGVDLAASVRAMLDLTSEVCVYIEAVHRLTELGAVVTQVVKGTWQEGSDAELRMIALFTVEGDFLGRCEIFDERDLDAALTRFDGLQPPNRRLDNSASRLAEIFFACVESHEWDAMAEIVADNSFFADRRHVVNLGVWHGRDLAIANMRVLHEIEASVTLTVIATRGERLALTRVYSLNRDLRHGEFDVELLSIVEADADNRIATLITFDPNDIDAAFAELDARYLEGEAAAHAHTWSVLMRAFAALNRHEVPAITSDWVRVDHRSLAPFEAGDWAAFLHATWDVTPNLTTYIEVVHRLSDLGAVVTHVSHGSSQDGMDAEWRIVDIFTVDGELISGAELFDEADLDTALARFDELDRRPMQENAATRIWSRLADAFNRRDLDGFFALTTANLRYEDRRKGLRDEFEGPARRKNMQAMFEATPSGSRLTVETIAIRGQRFSLTRAHYGDPDDAGAPIVEMLQVTEVSRDGLLHACVSFDPDDMNDAFAELTARWIASGEVTHPLVVEEIRRLNEIINLHDRDAFATSIAGATFVNHRQLSGPGAQAIADHISSIEMLAALVPDYWIELAEVLAQSATGLVDYEVLRGTSKDGVAIEIPLVVLILLDDGRVTRVEAFDANQRDLALARFEELSVQSQQK